LQVGSLRRVFDPACGFLSPVIRPDSGRLCSHPQKPVEEIKELFFQKQYGNGLFTTICGTNEFDPFAVAPGV